jgi:hypothetical protein
MKCLIGWVGCSAAVILAGRLEAAISSSVYGLERSRPAEEIESFSVRISVTLTEASLALGGASSAVFEDPRGGLHPVSGDLRNGNVSFGVSAPLEKIADAGGTWKLIINEGEGADEDLRIVIPATQASAFPLYPPFPEHPHLGDPARIRFVWNTASSSISTGGGSVVSSAGGSSIYAYAPGGPRSVAVSHIRDINGASISQADGTPRGPVTTQSLTSSSRMTVFTDAVTRDLGGQTTALDGTVEFLASGLSKGGRYAVLARSGDAAWTEIQRFTAVANAHLYEEVAGDEPRTFMIEADPNRAPSAVAQVLSAVEDTPLEVFPEGSDPDGDGLSFEIVTPPAHGTLEETEGGWIYLPDADFSGTDAFSFRANDGAERFAFSEPAQITVEVAAVNDVPVANDAEFFTMRGGLLSFTLPGSDVDGDPLTYQVLDAPAKGKLTGVAPAMSYRAKPAGQWTFQYTVSDGVEVSAPGTITLRVRPTNQLPVAQPAVVVANMEEATPLPLVALDADLDALTYRIVRGPTNGVLTGVPPALFYQSKPGFRGRDRVSFVANDGGAQSKPAFIDIQVINPSNRAPSADALVLAGPVRKAVTVVLRGTDPDRDPLGYRIVTPPANGRLSGRVPNLKFKPAAGFIGTTSFTYVVNDGALDSEPATVTLTIGVPADP